MLGSVSRLSCQCIAEKKQKSLARKAFILHLKFSCAVYRDSEVQVQINPRKSAHSDRYRCVVALSVSGDSRSGVFQVQSCCSATGWKKIAGAKNRLLEECYFFVCAGSRKGRSEKQAPSTKSGRKSQIFSRRCPGLVEELVWVSGEESVAAKHNWLRIADIRIFSCGMPRKITSFWMSNQNVRIILLRGILDGFLWLLCNCPQKKKI